MSAVGVIAEYNPFHNGHLLHLTAARRGGRVVAAMSGGFTQRGEPAILDKYARAEAALKLGASVVIELPVAFACSGAEAFSRGGVLLLHRTGVIDSLCFGAETPESMLLFQAAAEILATEPAAFSKTLRESLLSGQSFARARILGIQSALDCLYQGRFDINTAGDELRKPNNILALSYMTALLKYAPDVRPVPVARIGAGHLDDAAVGETASASYIRNRLLSGPVLSEVTDELASLMPPESLEILKRGIRGGAINTGIDGYSLILHYILLNEKFKCYIKNDDISGGGSRENASLHSRVAKAAEAEWDITAAVKSAASSRHTASRARRAVTRKLLGLPEEAHMPESPAYIRVLGFRREDADLLAEIVSKASLPVITNLKKAEAQLSGDEDARRMLGWDLLAQEMWSLGAGKWENELSKPMVIL